MNDMSINDQRWIKIELTLSTLRHFFYGKIPAEFFMSETSKIEELVNAIILIAPWIVTWLYPAPLENGIPCKILGKQFKSVLTDDKQLDSSVKHTCMAHPPHPHPTVTSNHLPRPHRESPWGDEKLSDTLTAEAWRKWKMLNFEIFPQWHPANLTAYQRL